MPKCCTVVSLKSEWWTMLPVALSSGHPVLRISFSTFFFINGHSWIFIHSFVCLFDCSNTRPTFFGVFLCADLLWVCVLFCFVFVLPSQHFNKQFPLNVSLLLTNRQNYTHNFTLYSQNKQTHPQHSFCTLLFYKQKYLQIESIVCSFIF